MKSMTPWIIAMLVAFGALMALCAAADEDRLPTPAPLDGEDPDPLPDVNVRPLYATERALDVDYDPAAPYPAKLVRSQALRLVYSAEHPEPPANMSRRTYYRHQA